MRPPKLSQPPFASAGAADAVPGDARRLPMTEVALASGFSSVRRFNDTFRNLFRRPPSALRRKGGAMLPVLRAMRARRNMARELGLSSNCHARAIWAASKPEVVARAGHRIVAARLNHRRMR